MNSTEDIDVAYVAHLARIHLTEDEIATFQGQLSQIVEHVRQLGELDVDDVEPTSHALPVHTILRPDSVRQSLDRDAAMANAPAHRSGQYLVPRIID